MVLDRRGTIPARRVEKQSRGSCRTSGREPSRGYDGRSPRLRRAVSFDAVLTRLRRKATADGAKSGSTGIGGSAQQRNSRGQPARGQPRAANRRKAPSSRAPRRKKPPNSARSKRVCGPGQGSHTEDTRTGGNTRGGCGGAGGSRFSANDVQPGNARLAPGLAGRYRGAEPQRPLDRKSTRLNSSHGYISYAVFCLKQKKTASR